MACHNICLNLLMRIIVAAACVALSWTQVHTDMERGCTHEDTVLFTYLEAR